VKKISFFILILMLIASANAQSFFADAAADLQGVTIRGVSESSPPSRYVAEVLAQQFEDETGIRVEFEATSWDQMYDKAIKDMEANTGIYDFVYIEQDIIYSYLARDFLVDVEAALEANPDLRAPNVDFSDFTTFADNFRGDNGNLYGVPMEAFIKVYLYRKDLFEDPDIQAAFAEAYGYDLAPATTFAQYRDNAEFFTQYGEDNNLQLWGTTVQGSTGHPASTYEFLETIAPSFGLYDWGISDDFRASVENGGELNSDTAKEALAYWIDLLQFAPPEATSSTWDEVASSFAAGRAAQGWVYGENAAWIATDPDRSIVIGNVGVSLPPTAPGVIEDAEAGLGYIGYYDGGAFGIPYSSQNQEAALLFLQYIAQNEVQADWAVASARITHTATYDDAKVIEQDARVDGYYSLMREEGRLFKGAPEYPFHNPIRETIDPFIHRALTGELTASEALDQAAAAVDARLIELGFAE
jgi:multiple sugar transport system substrate-binding protein